MSGFNDSMEMGDSAALNEMGEEKPLQLWKPGIETMLDVTAIVLPVQVGGVFRGGGVAEVASLEVEVSRQLVKENGVEDGWRVRFENKDYLVTDLRFQGGTITLICGSVSDASVKF